MLLEVDADAVDELGEVLDTAVGDDLGEELGDVEIGGRRQSEEDVAWEGARCGSELGGSELGGSEGVGSVRTRNGGAPLSSADFANATDLRSA